MKKEIIFNLFLLSVLAVSCSSDKQSAEGLPYFDVTKNYSEKVVDLADIADLRYVYLSTKNEDFLYRGTIDYVTQNTIVVADRTSSSVLFFSKEGDPKSCFNRKGQGPEEYSSAGSVMYDETEDEVYIIPDFNNYINVYSSSGEFKRKLTLPQVNIGNQMLLFDDQSILVYDNTNLWQNLRKVHVGDRTAVTQVNDSSFYLLSRMDGKVLEYIEMPTNDIDVSTINKEGAFGQVGYGRMRWSPDGLLLYNPETDTVFFYNKDKTLTPFMHKKPLLSDLNPMMVMDICMDVGDYQFISVHTYQKSEFPSPIYYMRDKKTDEIFRPKVVLADYKGKDFTFDPRLQNYYEKGYHFELDFVELQEAYRENKLSGELKELVATLDGDEGNNIFLLVDFK
ncbi:hypothetical protein M2137_000588 [Parabacteroides sp. PFB2-10]|uniref:6-bladed beta-propeller n=1 Tax=Parabacteroides sp. PFB2-10 TaxID=1742405 RepID=UPI002476F489|nr:6-bladed beta-propeller [Parabacteroides sp. PFB2-10]MDH6311829.1 hypothetical protein [Parabacteroides sp. PFB2-10]MDL2245367.1 6-bladed beta-propeller [Parabacteroides sp. OttesenSCG-928-J18]